MDEPKQSDQVILVVGIPGSLREGSYTRLAVEAALAGARERGARTELLDLRDYELASCAGKVPGGVVPADVLRLRRAVRPAHGIILGTPEYHGSYSGALKNALDWMGFDEFEGKMVGLVSVGGGALGGFAALSHLQGVGRALHAWVVPQQASIAQAWNAFTPAGRLKDADLEERIREVGRQVARFAFLHNSHAAREFLRQWEDALPNPGGEEFVQIPTGT